MLDQWIREQLQFPEPVLQPGRDSAELLPQVCHRSHSSVTLSPSSLAQLSPCPVPQQPPGHGTCPGHKGRVLLPHPLQSPPALFAVSPCGAQGHLEQVGLGRAAQQCLPSP